MKILEGVTSFRLVYNVPAQISDREGIKVIKDGGPQKTKKKNKIKKSELSPSAIFTGADNYLSAEFRQ